MNSMSLSLIYCGNSAGSVAQRTSQQGGARIRLIIFLVIVGLMGWSAYKVVPPYMANYQLEDWMRTQAPYWLVNHTTDEVLVDNILKEIDARGIPATKDNVKILANNSRDVKVSVDYTVHIDLSFYQFDLHFNPVMDNQSLIQ
ncbi:MAG TPA: hypothetical protein VFO34_18310 [Candidatus Acidoferrales bacterium]|nr:hypothetical protein [Candidatus Acidoferrales bacterium]